ncbi:MAG: cadmium-translocating P-type ATPase, partial [Pseudomonas sp.]|nr:cadmium-translocating P-type ATPase [Pseudomonas sp.]
YYFCNPKCREKFIADPEKYLADEPRKEDVPAGTIYICPMHPEIRQVGTGSCPICGMALEPELVSLEDAPNPELIDMTRRLLVAVVLTIPVFFLEMIPHLTGISFVPAQYSGPLQFLFATPVVLWAGWPFFQRGYASVVSGNLNMFTLIAMGTGVAWLYSVVALFVPSIFPPAFRDHHGNVALYFEAAAVITALVLLGQVLELRAREQTSGAIKALLGLAPKQARKIKEDGSEEDVAVDSIFVGDTLRVRPGEKIPVDGVVIEGRSSIDESMVTGESMPVSKEKDAKLIAGTVNQSGALVMKATKVGRDPMLSQIVQMVAQAQRSAAPIQRLADRVSAWFVPLVISAALLAFAAWALFGPEPRYGFALVAAVTVLIIACPCALGLATPMSIMVGVGRGAQMGVLVKNAAALERMESVDTIVIDKTGTLTLGRPVASNLGEIAANYRPVLLALAQMSRHPLSAALTRDLTAQGVHAAAIDEVQETPGFGVAALWQGRPVTLGRPQGADAGSELASELSIDGQSVALVRFADALRPDAVQAIAALRAEGVDSMILSGDRTAAVAPVARTLGLTAMTGLSPQDKLAAIARSSGAGHKVLMIGDGLNDGPALAAGHASMAPGSASDVGKNASDCIFMGDRLMPVVDTIRMARRTQAIVRQNFALAIGYNVIAVPLAFAGLVTPLVAAIAMSGSSLIVVGNALRLKGALK